MTTYEDVIREFQKRRLERDILAVRVKEERMKKLHQLAVVADIEMKQLRKQQRLLASS